MRTEEARWIGAQLAALPLDQRSPLINIGSSTREFREIKQPHIDRLIFAPMRAAGLEIIHSDLKSGEGIDIAGDLHDPEVQARMRAIVPRVVLCSNVLEHVEEPSVLASIIKSLLPIGGHAIVTVPCSYPYHPDPIDTGFRPSPRELMGLFPGCNLVTAEIVEDGTYANEIFSSGWPGILKGAKSIMGALRLRGDIVRAHRAKLRWMLRPFSTSCILIRI